MSWWEDEETAAPDAQPLDHGPGGTVDFSSMPPPSMPPPTVPEAQQLDHGPGGTPDLSSMPPPTAAGAASGGGMGAGMLGGLLAGALVLGGIGYVATRGGDDGAQAQPTAAPTVQPAATGDAAGGGSSGGSARVLAGGTLCDRYLSFWNDAPYPELMVSPDGSAPDAEFLDDPEWLAVVLPHNAWMADGLADLLAVTTPRYRADLEAVVAAAGRDRESNYPSGGSDWSSPGGSLTSLYDGLDRECGLG